MKDTMKLDIVGITDVGRSRDHNEDFIAWNNDLGLAVLADGMGGHNAGEVASKMSVDTILNNVKGFMGSFNKTSAELSDELQEEDAVGMSLEAISEANFSVFTAASENPAYKGMGTTLVMALLHGSDLIISHVGDSRLYRFRKSELEQLTLDHSLYQEMITGGFMSEEEADQSLNKNMITRALGIAEDVEIDVQQQVVNSGDVYLLCSDGLSDMLSYEEIKAVMDASGKDMKLAAQTMINQANDNGGADNISVILMHAVPVIEKSEIYS